ncbi:MAG: RNA-directed DNA polymerase [Geodermatophilaceae bacterium]|nr:RNA-directed DNA polymerase [Geodermatophilaceae bacterium]
MAGSRWPVATVDDLADLAGLLDLSMGHLGWYADPAGMQRRNRVPALQLYRYRWLDRPGRAPRLLEVLKPRLRRAQRMLLDRIVGLVPAHAAAHGFVAGRSARTGAAPHVGTDVVIGLDLAGFFGSVSAHRIYGILRVAGYPEAVAHIVTGLCTTATPIAVLGTMPPGGPVDDRYALRRALTTPHLPQGAPTSPQLANLSAYRLDCRLAGLAAAVGATYTRYADDLSLSGGPEVARQTARIVGGVRRIVSDEGFRLNEGKTRVQPRAGRQTVTGIVVNERANAARADYDRLRAILHNAARTGAQGQNRGGHRDFRSHLLGRIAWVEALNPARGRRLRADFDRIDWT